AARHDVGGGDAAGEGHLDAGVVRVDGVEGAEARGDGVGGLVAVGMRGDAGALEDADVRMSIDKAGDDDEAFDVAHLGAVRDLDGVDGTDVDDLPLVDDEDTDVDDGPARRVDAGATVGDRGVVLLLGGRLFLVAGATGLYRGEGVLNLVIGKGGLV